jgi:NADH-quinone oxidoreductase subunit H
VDAQQGTWLGIINHWWIFVQPLGFMVYAIAGVAETNRAPFDFPEAEQELVAGYNTEYSSVRFALFPQAEYINMATMSAVATDLYFGGWHGLLPFYTPLDPLIERYGLGWAAFLAKVSGFLFFYIWMRWTLPRYRYDQLMGFGWKFLLPVSVVNLLVTAAVWLYFNA